MFPLKFKNLAQIFIDFLLKIYIYFFLLRLYEFGSSGNYGEMQSSNFENVGKNFPIEFYGF